MSMISELVDRLIVEAKSMGTYGTDYMATLLMRSADTIEMLSEKARESDEPQTEMTTEQIVNELLSIKKILDDGKMPKQTHDICTETHECVKDTHDKTEPQTERRCGNCKHLTYRWNKTWCDIKCDNPHDMVCDKWERSE